MVEGWNVVQQPHQHPHAKIARKIVLSLQSGVGGWVTIVVKLLSPDVHLNILTGHLNLLLTKSCVYDTISDYHDNRLSKDPCGEVAIKFNGKLTNDQIKEVIANLTPGDISINEIDPIQCKDFDYDIDPEDGTYRTLVYSPDGYDYLDNMWK